MRELEQMEKERIEKTKRKKEIFIKLNNDAKILEYKFFIFFLSPFYLIFSSFLVKKSNRKLKIRKNLKWNNAHSPLT